MLGLLFSVFCLVLGRLPQFRPARARSEVLLEMGFSPAEIEGVLAVAAPNAALEDLIAQLCEARDGVRGRAAGRGSTRRRQSEKADGLSTVLMLCQGASSGLGC